MDTAHAAQRRHKSHQAVERELGSTPRLLGTLLSVGLCLSRAWLPPTDARVHHWNHQQPEPFLLWQCCARLDLPLVSHQAGYPGHPGAAPRGNHLPRQSLPPSIPGQSLGWGGFPPTLRTLGLHLHTRPVLTPFCFLSRLIGTPPKHRHHSLSPFVLPLSPCIWE